MKALTTRLSAIALAFGSVATHASLQDLIDDGSFNTLEEEAAIAALSTYDRLIAQAGCEDRFLIDPGAVAPNCTGQTYLLFSNVREIIHTANELTNDGPTAFSLGSDIQGLGFALRWTAAEEYAAQGNLSGEFIGGQVSGLASRLTALRAGASGFDVIGIGSNWQNSSGKALASAGAIRGAGASADNGGGGYGRWGGFLNYDAGNGERSATVLEDAFDFENSQITFGVDYRATDHWVFGIVFGISDQEIDFDASQSIVEGTMTSEGTSIMPFAMWQKGAWFVSSSFGIQNMSFETERAIRYPSFNPDTPSTDTVSVSDTDADMTSLFLEGGYTFQWQKFSVEPYANIKISDIKVDGFVEDDINDDAFDLVIQGQDIESTELTFGTKLQYTLTPSYGVFVPYLTIEAVNQSDDAPRVIQAYYAQDVSDETAFNVPTESLDSSYTVYTIGTSAVLRGGRQKTLGGAVGGDIQGFVNYKTIEGLEGFDIESYSLGLRYTF